jgi:hypothetical protein
MGILLADVAEKENGPGYGGVVGRVGWHSDDKNDPGGADRGVFVKLFYIRDKSIVDLVQLDVPA